MSASRLLSAQHHPPVEELPAKGIVLLRYGDKTSSNAIKSDIADPGKESLIWTTHSAGKYRQAANAKNAQFPSRASDLQGHRQDFRTEATWKRRGVFEGPTQASDGSLLPYVVAALMAHLSQRRYTI